MPETRTHHRQHRRKLLVSPAPFFLFVGVVATAAIGVIAARTWSVHPLVAYLAGVNATSFCLYGHDKLMSMLGFLRVPERTLHLFDFAGGTPAAILARWLFRHKTSKASFRRTFWLLAVIQAALLAWALWYFR